MSLIKLEGKIGQMVGKLYQKIKNYLNACLAAYQKTELAACGEDVVIYSQVCLIYPQNIYVGSHSHLGGGGNDKSL